MALSVSSIGSIMEHSLRSREVAAALGGNIAAMNRVARVVASLRDWRFLKRIASLDLTAGEDHTPLPGDFGKLWAQEASRNVVGAVKLVSDDELIRLRENTAANGGSTYQGAIFAADNTSGSGGAQTWRIELDRPVQVSQTNAFTIVYRRDWRDMTSEEDELSMPPYMDELYLQVLRAYVQDYQFESRGRRGAVSFDQRLEGIVRGQTYRAAISMDTNQIEYGEITGGHVDVGHVYRDWGSNATVEGI